nr:KH domain-containing protein akap-1 [Ciona intestinalis]|eukprot:XP_026690008.1 KH domain-containing protein akap-1 [Ciona intestinalis]
MPNKWQESRVIITATGIPLALLLCWWVYRRSLKGRLEQEKQTKKLNGISGKVKVPLPENEDEVCMEQPSLLDAIPDVVTSDEDVAGLIDQKKTSETNSINNNNDQGEVVLEHDLHDQDGYQHCVEDSKNESENLNLLTKNKNVELTADDRLSLHETESKSINESEEPVSEEVMVVQESSLEAACVSCDATGDTTQELTICKEVVAPGNIQELINDSNTQLIENIQDSMLTSNDSVVDVKHDTINSKDSVCPETTTSSLDSIPPTSEESLELENELHNDFVENIPNTVNNVVEVVSDEKEEDVDSVSYNSLTSSITDDSNDEESVTLLDAVDSSEENSDEEKNLPSEVHSNPMSLGETSSEVTSVESCSRVDTDKDSLEEGPIYQKKTRNNSENSGTNNSNNNNNNTVGDLKVLESRKGLMNGNDCKSCHENAGDSKNEGKTNGWKDDEEDENEHKKDDGKRKIKNKQKFVRPSSLSDAEERSSNDPDRKFEVFVEFPSERVGLLIGKQGRNINQLKQDSGAEVFVHEAPFREDIQVLQICGIQSEVESCVSRIKRRFNDLSLASFDDPSSLSLSPRMSTPTHHASPNYHSPTYNISQLCLPEGATIDVVVSAIADVDCIFVQQPNHPSFHSFPNLERAMAVCYQEGTSPGLPNPAQVGLICVAQQMGTWYRAQIVHCFEDIEELSIRLMDYGGYTTVPAAAAKQIRADFLSLPFQALECYLDNISSPTDDNSFCSDSVNRLQELLAHGRFQVRVTGYRSNGIPRIHLFRLHNHKVTLINQEMATKGLATWVEPAPFQSN